MTHSIEITSVFCPVLAKRLQDAAKQDPKVAEAMIATCDIPEAERMSAQGQTAYLAVVQNSAVRSIMAEHAAYVQSVLQRNASPKD